MTGYVKYYICSNCHYEEEFRQGPGFLVKPQSLEEYISGNQKLFHYKIHNKIIAMAEAHPGLLISASYQVYKCPHCQILYNKSQANIMVDGQTLHQNVFKCRVCRRRLKPTNMNRLKKAVCPSCGKSSFHRHDVSDLLWKK